MALEFQMQGERKLLGLAIFLQLACGQTVRDFGTAHAGADPGGEAGASGAAAGGAGGAFGAATGGGGGASGAAAGGTGGALGLGGQDNAGTSGSSVNGGKAGSGVDAPPGVCTVDLDCASQPHVRAGAPATCSQGKCSIPASSCEQGYGHCSDSELEFCETSLTTVSDCGACGKACPSALPLCTAGQCVSTCASAKPDTCAGTCVDKMSDPANCGACGTSCLLPNADANCSKGVCTAFTCKAGYGDCTSAPGCETRLDSLTNCGGCNQNCGASGDIASCSTGTCSVSCTSHPEDCFNGKDDDCDGQIDCADSDCSGPAQCVPAATWAYGTAIAAQATCPAGFLGSSSTVHSVVSGGNGCGGCGCNPTTTDCAPYTITLTKASQLCSITDPVSTTIVLSQSNAACAEKSTASLWNALTWTTSPKFNCANTGTPKATAPTWTDDSKFCAASAAGSGCSAGNVCVLKPPGSACLLASGSLGCPSQFPIRRSLYNAFTDTRVCSCSCQGNGGACDDIQFNASGESCTNASSVPQDGGLCEIQSASQIFFSFSGAATPPTTCTPSNVMTGTLTPTGPQTLCCQ